MPKITAICDHKGGVGEILAAVSLGVGLIRIGKRVFLVDVDAQGSLIVSLGHQHPDQIEKTLTAVMSHIIMNKSLVPSEGVIHHKEGIDLFPASIERSDSNSRW